MCLLAICMSSLEIASLIVRVGVPPTVNIKGASSPNWSWANQKVLSGLDLDWVTQSRRESAVFLTLAQQHDNWFLWPHFPDLLWFISVFQTWSWSIPSILGGPPWLYNILSMASQVKSVKDKWLVWYPWVNQWDSQVLNVYVDLNILSTNSSLLPKSTRNNFCDLKPRILAYSQNRNRNILSYKILLSKKMLTISTFSSRDYIQKVISQGAIQLERVTSLSNIKKIMSLWD